MWSIGKPKYDLESVGDTLLLGITSTFEEYLCNVQVEASLCGMTLNLDKTEIVPHPKGPTDYDNTTVKLASTSKCLGTMVAWNRPTLTAAFHSSGGGIP